MNEQIDRLSVVAEAKVLVQQLDDYVALMGEWIAEEDEDDADV